MKKTALFLIFSIFITMFASCSPNGEGSDVVSDAQSIEESADVSAEESEMIEEKILDGSKLVVFGDSITALGSWGKTVAMECNMEYFNGARGGITSAEGLLRFNAFVKSRSPRFCDALLWDERSFDDCEEHTEMHTRGVQTEHEEAR